MNLSTRMVDLATFWNDLTFRPSPEARVAAWKAGSLRDYDAQEMARAGAWAKVWGGLAAVLLLGLCAGAG